LDLRIVIPLIVAGALVLFAVLGAQGTSILPGSSTPENGSTTTGSRQGQVSKPAEDGGADASDEAAGKGLYAAVPPAGASSRHLIRTGDVSLLIDRGTLISSVDRIAAMTADMGGYVLSSSAGSGPMGVPRAADKPVSGWSEIEATGDREGRVDPHEAWLSVRVPEGRFDEAIKRIGALGDVRHMTTSSEDVTSQFIDLQARLRHHRAVEQRLLRFLAESGSVRDMLAVQDRLDATQLTIEQTEAQLKSLRETTVFSTISVNLAEKGSTQASRIDPSDSFSGVLWDSLTLLGRGARIATLALTAALPFIVVLGTVALIVWYGWRRLRGRRNAEHPSIPA
jgi:hypothetical protein